MEIIGFAVIWLLFGFVAMLIANSKGRSGCGWFLLGFLFGPFALVVAFLPSLVTPHPININIDSDSPNPNTHARCSHCAEVILKAAKICKHCGGKKVGDNWDTLYPQQDR